MKKRRSKFLAFLLSAMMLITGTAMGATPAQAAETKTLPTKVENCEVSGFSPQVINLGFGDNSATKSWLNSITKVTVNDTEYKNEKIDWGSSGDLWYIDSYTGAYGSYPALKVTIPSEFPATIVASADGYADMTIKITYENSTYTAEIVKDSTEPSNPEPTPTPTEKKDAPALKSCSTDFGYDFDLTFDTSDTEWIKKITGIKINEESWEKSSYSSLVRDNKKYYVNADSNGLLIGEGFTNNPATCVITADGYNDLTLTLDKTTHTATVNKTEEPAKSFAVTISDTKNGTVNVDKTSAKEGETVTITAAPDKGYQLDSLTVKTASGKDVTITDGKFTMPAEDVTLAATFAAETPAEDKEFSLDNIAITTDIFGHDWIFTFQNDDDYVKNISGISVNGTAWELKTSVSTGGCYALKQDVNQAIFSKNNFSTSGPDVLKSGDVITITANGYKTLTFKVIVDPSGKMTVQQNDDKGDPYRLHAKLEGSFEAAIIGQKNYDGVSGATTGSTSNKNSSVTVYGALIEGEGEPADSDWNELDNYSSKIDLDGSKCKVNIVPDTSKGTSIKADSGMSGVYMTISSSLTLSGTPKDAGDYLISITITDKQGRTAVSNALPFRIYTGEETLAEQMVVDNMTQTQDGKYMWDIMEPWAIEKFGSNVDGEKESVRVLKDMKAWYGSHESGTYGYLGYDLDWDKVMAGDIPQTLYIPKGCDLTLVNMEILSSVHIIVEDGGKLTLRDSVVQGIIDVEGGGTFSMNYDSYNDDFLTGASVCGQIRLADGATLENAAIYSHANYLANGDKTDRTTAEPVVKATGNVTFKGKVFIQGDSSGDNKTGQAGLLVKDGTVTIPEGSELVAIGGDSTVQLFPTGGDGIQLDNGFITGDGKTTAIGGAALFGNGGTAVTGTGKISTNETFLRGATAFGDATPGKAMGDNIKVVSPSKSVKDGEQAELGANDPISDLYWKTGINPTPPLDNYVTEKVPEYTITVANTENGTASVSKDSAIEGESVTVKASPADDYKVSKLYYSYEDAEGKTLKKDITEDAFFEMPASNVTVTVEFVKGSNGSGDNDPNGNGSNGNTGNNGNGSNSNGNAGNGTDSNQNAGTSSQTGDNATPILWVAIMLTALAAMGTTVLWRRKQNAGR